MSAVPVIPPDERLVGQVLGGESAAFRLLVRRHAGGVAAIARGFGVDRTASDDVMQDVFAAAYERLGQLRDPSRFGGWLHEIARNRCRKHVAREARRPDADAAPITDVPAAIADASPAPDADAVAAALERLPDDYRAALELRHVDGLGLAEIGARLGLEVNGVNARLYRARQMMRRLMKGDER